MINKTVYVSSRVSVEFKERIHKYVEKEKTTIAKLIRRLLKEEMITDG